MESWKASAGNNAPFEHLHRNSEGESKATREEWIKSSTERAQANGLDVTGRQTPDGYVFQFNNFLDYAQFYLNTYGDIPTPRGHLCTQRFPNGVDENWVNAAKMYMDELGVDYELRITSNEVTFACDRFSESANLRLLIDQGAIDDAVQTLLGSRSFLKRTLDVRASDETHLQI